LSIQLKSLVGILTVTLSLASLANAGPGQWVVVPLHEKPYYIRSPQDVRTIHFFDAEHGVCAGSGMWRTMDGGISWRRVTIPKIRNQQTDKEGHGWRYVRMVSPQEIWACGQLGNGGREQTQMLRSTDGGKNWQQVLTGQLDHVGPLLFNKSTWWVLCERGTAAHVSRDRGQSWTPVNWGKSNRNIFHLCFATNEVGYAVGECSTNKGNEGAVWITTDGGRNWRSLPFPGDEPPLKRCSFITARQGWVGGGRGRLWRTEDGGQSWELCEASFLANQTITGVTFFPGGEGFVGAEVPYGKQSVSRLTASLAIAFTPDGGKTWTPAATGFKSINEMFFLDREHAWACGRNRGETPGPLVMLYEP